MEKMDRKEFVSGFWRSACIQGCFCYERQQALGFAFGMIPHLKRIYADDKDGLAKALRRHCAFYNISPQFTSFVQGIAVAMEEQAHDDPEFDVDSINAVKVALMGPLSGIGDSLFFGTFRTIGIGIGLGFCAQGNPIGPILMLLVHNIPHWLLRWYGLKIGYERGIEFMTEATESGLLETFTYAAKILGATVVGAMISSNISFTTSLYLNVGEYLHLNIQGIFDAIMPKMLSALLAVGSFMLVRKGKKTTTVMGILFLLGFIIALLEGIPAFQAPPAA